MKIKYFVYILRSQRDGKTYVGYTSDLQNRVRQHNENVGGYTKNRGPWDLIWYGAFDSHELAEKFESYLKSGSGIAFARKRLI
ncbi:MAG: GIY-YIG nuclease family protein [Candidatus Margulisiibacteriota bacterium]